MRSFVFLLIALLLATTNAAAAESANLNQHPLVPFSRWEVAQSPDGGLWLAYYTEENQLYLRGPEGETTRLGFTDRPEAPSGLFVAVDDKGPVALWRDKQGRKNLFYYRGGRKLVRLGGDSEPLPRMRFAHSGGRELFLWYGEQPDED